MCPEEIGYIRSWNGGFNKLTDVLFKIKVFKQKTFKNVVNQMLIKFIGHFSLLFTSECSFAPINIAICVSRRRRMFEEGDNVLSDVACVLRPSADPKMWPG